MTSFLGAINPKRDAINRVCTGQRRNKMSELYKNKYRVESARWKNWDYSSDGSYFITICTKNRRNWFGDSPAVETTFMTSPKKRFMTSPYSLNLSPIGKLTEKFWHEIPQRYPGIKLGEFVVMPDHVHLILIVERATAVVQTTFVTSLEMTSPEKAKFVPPRRDEISDVSLTTVGEIIRWYKGRITFEARKIDKNFKWGSRFWDRVIRDQEEFDNTSEYIRMNPWKCVMDFDLTDEKKVSAGLKLRGMGNPGLWSDKKLGVLCSRNAPKPDDIPNAEVYFGGFHSPMEKQIMNRLLELKRPIVYCPAWGLDSRLSPEMIAALNGNRMLILEMHNVDGDLAAAEERNRFVMKNADDLWIPYVSTGGMLSRLMQP